MPLADATSNPNDFDLLIGNRTSLDAQTAIAERSRMFDRALSSITDFAYIFDLEGRFTFANKPLLDLWGLSGEQAIGKNFHELNYPGDLSAKLQRQIQEVIQTRERLVDETPYTSPTGTQGYYQYIFSPVIGSDGTVEAVAGSTRDITDFKRLQAEHERLARTIEGERAKLAAIIAQAPAFICTLRGPNHVFELANQRYYEIVGKRDLIGKAVLEALPEVKGQGFIELLDQVYRTGQTYAGTEMPLLLRESEGGPLDRRFVNFIYQALREPDGAISGIFVHGMDVTEMVLAREALRQSEERRRLALDSAELGAWHLDPATMTLETDERFRAIFGVAAPVDYEQAVARIHPDDRDRVRDAVLAASRPVDPQPFALEYRVTLADRSIRWVFAKGRANLVRNGSGTQMASFDGTIADITEKKQLADERERLLDAERAARAEAEQANRAKDKFLAVLSHELRTPLSPVTMTIPAMEIDADMPFKFREDLAMVRRNIDLEVKLIDDLLDLSRITTGKLRLQMQSVSAHDLLRHALRNTLSEIAGKRLNIHPDFTATNDQLTADPARLQQVFWNLLRNAVKFTPDEGEIFVRTWNAVEAGHLHIEVRDTGIGIEAEVLPKIFDAFEQGEVRMTRQFGGLGLGLAIAKAVVEMHGGTITVASAGKNQGSAFTVQLNTTSPRASARIDGNSPSFATDRTPNRARLLLVEDHPDTSRTLARLLTRSGYAVKTAGSMASALQLAAAEPFDIVVSDIGLPDATGYELMEQIRDRHGIKGIALSGYGMEDDMRKSREAGFVDHVVKPVNVAQLLAVLQRVSNNE